MKSKHLIETTLNSKKIHISLLVLVFVVSILVFKISSSTAFPDAEAYWIMGEGILHGRFSSWYFLTDYYPETLRTPGYPVFLAICQLISKSMMFAKIIQLLLYFISIKICLQIIKKIKPDLIYRNLFLILLIPNIQIVYYTGYISSEILAVFFTTVMVSLIFSKDTIKNALFLGIVSYLLFIVKPAFLIFPFLLFAYFFFKKKKKRIHSLLFIASFGLLLIPFGIWNKINHNQFKITSIEGGAGVAHMGFWQLKLPDGYTENFYWGNTTAYDLTKPELYSKNEYEDNVNQYANEWTKVLNNLSKYNTAKDDSIIALMKKENPNVFVLHNSKYTEEREKQLWDLTIKHIKAEPWYYLKSRIYHLFRFYVTGINYNDYNQATTFTGKAKTVYPFIITFVFIFTGLLFITLMVLYKKHRFENWLPIVILLWYTGIIHVPFAIQARYTIPVHLILLLALAIIIGQLKNIKTHE